MDLDCCPVRGFLVGLGRPEKRGPSFEIDRQFNQQLNNCHEWLYLSPIIKYPNSYVHLLFHGRPWTGIKKFTKTRRTPSPIINTCSKKSMPAICQRNNKNRQWLDAGSCFSGQVHIPCLVE
ncbi:hypothetical protein NC652_005711 [Populus alba x Populus x berolinensis]|nr:hypothetical protein NC652_005711 [Populus alba x Populus x berolinensis]